MRSGYHRGFAESIEEKFSECGETAKACAEILVKMKSGFFEPSYMDIVVQDDFNNLDMVDAYIFGSIHSDICMGKIFYSRIPVGCTPCTDKSDEIGPILDEIAGRKYSFSENAEPLSINVKFWGGNAIGDGLVEWQTPLYAGKLHENMPNGFEKFDPGAVPLEMGSTRSTTTFYHLITAGGVARWPYGSEDVVILLRPPRLATVE